MTETDQITPDYQSNPIHAHRSQQITFPNKPTLTQKRLIFANSLPCKNMQIQFTPQKPPYLLTDPATAFYRPQTNLLTPQEHYLFLSLFYWHGTDFQTWASFCELTTLPITAVVNYFNLNAPILREFATKITEFAASARGHSIIDYYSQYDFFTSAQQIQAPITSNYGSICRIIGGKLSQFTGKIVNPVLVQDGNFECQNGLLSVSAQERMCVNVLKAPVAGIRQGGVDSFFGDVKVVNKGFFGELKPGKSILEVSEVEKMAFREKLILGEIFANEIQQDSEVMKLLEKLTQSLSTAQQLEIVQELMNQQDEKQEILQQIKKLRMAIGKPVMAAWAKQLYDKMTNVQKNSQIIDINQFCFVQTQYQKLDQINFFDGPVLQGKDQFEVPKIPQMDLLQLSLEKVFQ